MGVSHGQKCVGDGSRKIAEVWGNGAEFLPLGSIVGGKAYREGNGDLGDGGMVIWNARNRFCFEEKQSQPNEILQGAITLI